MTSIKQVDILSAGAQPWNVNICSASGNRFVYAATLAIYIYEYQSELHSYRLHSVMCEHRKTITAVACQQKSPDMFTSMSSDGTIIVWNISKQCVVSRLVYTGHVITGLEWCLPEENAVSFGVENGLLLIWKYLESNEAIKIEDLVDSFNFSVTIFKWNPRETRTVCFGHSNGTISVLFEGKKMKKHIFKNVATIEDRNNNNSSKIDNDKNKNGGAVTCLEWDLLSTDYLLYATEKNCVRLVDVKSEIVITEFLSYKTEVKIHKYCWISSAPGMFISADAKSGILRLWSVANTKNLVNIKVKDKGLHSICVIADSASNKIDYNQLTASIGYDYTIPPAKILCVFKDGGIGVYNLRRGKWDFLREKGHIETIFDCKFHPDNPDLLATSSFDGSIKTWNITNMEMEKESPGNSGVVYSISWAPGDVNCICAATAKKGLIVWNTDSNQITHEFNEHGTNSIFTCCWNQQNSTVIASGGADNNCIVRRLDGTLVKKYRHSGNVYGCDWNPKNRDMLATASEDCAVRVFYLPATSNKPIKIFSGHTAKVFQVKWSPLRDGILCSSSDDKTLRVWDYSEDGCLLCLEGHTEPTRGLIWSTELPNILISGSWDRSIKLWDTRTGHCLGETFNHSADVYGLASHPQRPFLFASSSRDSTLRIWCLHNFVQPIFLSLVSDENINHSHVDAIDEVNIKQQMCGSFSEMLNLKKDEDLVSKYQLYCRFLLPPEGIENLWLLSTIISDRKKTVLPENYGQGIMHISHQTAFYSSRAQTIETVRSSFQSGIGSKKKKEQLLQAAEIYVKIGELEKYCEILCVLDEWQKALSIAPGVSFDYWRTLTQRYADILRKRENSDSTVYYLASGDIKKLFELYQTRHEYNEAILCMQMAMEKDLNIEPTYNIQAKENKKTAEEFPKMLELASKTLVERYVCEGKPVLAACCCLATDDYNGAVCVLLRCNEIELGYCLSTCLPVDEKVQKECCWLLAMRCERLKQWNSGISILKGYKDLLLEFCAKYEGSNSDKNLLLSKAGLPSMGECSAVTIQQQRDELQSMRYHLFLTSHEKAFHSSLNAIKKIFTNTRWCIDDVIPYIDILGAVKTDHIQRTKKKLRSELLCMAAYIGALRAVRLKYTNVVDHLFLHAFSFTKSDIVDLGIPMKVMMAEHESWLFYGSNGHGAATEEQKIIYNGLIRKCGHPIVEELCGNVAIASQNLPMHSESYTNMFTKEKISGHVILLEDGKSALPCDVALMWAKVNPFSPLATGCRLNPF